MFAAERCHEALIDLLLAQPQCDVKITANGGFTAGVMAAVNGRPDLARKLISIQKEQEAAADREKKEENLGRSKGKPPRKKKIEAEAAQASPAPAQGSSSATVSFANASASEHRGKTFRVLCRPPSSLDAGTPAERKATRIRSAIREARTVAQSVGEELGWSNGEVVSVEEVARKSDGSVPGEELEVAVTFAF